MYMRIFQVLITSLILVTIARSSEVKTEWCSKQKANVQSSKQNDCTIRIDGQIVPKDLATLSKSLSLREPKTPLTVFLNSPGGDVATALEMSRALRMAEATVSVPIGSQCSSSCVFLLAGGVVRIATGDVFVHRPYSNHIGNFDSSKIANDRNTLIFEMRKLLDELNVSPLLIEEMDAAPPESTVRLSNEKLKLFRIVGADPVYAERMDAQCAAELKITRTEIINRRARCFRSSKNVFENISCEPCKNWSPTSGVLGE